MNTRSILFTFCCLISYYGQSVMAQTVEQNFNKLKWIEGTWIRTNNKAGQYGEERWVYSSNSELTGNSFTLRNSDTLFIERMYLRKMDNQLFYVADVPENKKPIYFKLTAVSDTGFVCENPQHDFPKKIAYEYKDKILKASISGNGKIIDYYFERQ